MTIQPSILLWTLICFALMMLILDRLLFRPVLSFMDARNEKIAAAQKKTEYERALADAEAELAARREQAVHRTADLARAELADAKERAKSIVAKAETDREIRVKQGRTDVAERERTLAQELAPSVDDLAKAFLDKLVS